MDYTEFKNAVYQEIDDRTNHALLLSLRTVPKNNGLLADTLCIATPGVNIAPSIYLKPYYNRFLGGMSLEDIYDDIEAVYEQTKKDSDFDLSRYLDFSRAQENLVMRLINFEQNKDLLKDLPHIRFLDLAIVFYVLLEKDFDGSSGILVHNSHMKFWKQTSEDLYRLALKNTPRQLPARFEPITSFCPPDYTDYVEEFPMFVLSSDILQFGAVALLYPGLLQEIADLLGSDLMIIPSSIHEVIIFPCQEDRSKDYFNEIICMINETEVADTETLSDHLYFYSRESEEITM